jgi:RNA polymerase sigma-70 factor (ECF subfamily)
MEETPDIPEEIKKEKGLWEKTRKSLIERLNNWEDQKTWNEFYQTYWRLIYSVATKAGLTREEAFDVIQETTIAIARQVQKGQYDPRAGSFKAWLLQMTRWRVLDVFRARKRQPGSARKFLHDVLSPHNWMRHWGKRSAHRRSEERRGLPNPSP